MKAGGLTISSGGELDGREIQVRLDSSSRSKTI